MQLLNNSNINYIEPKDFNITPDNVRIWYGELPFNSGDKFPTDDIIKRASEYATYKKLYYNEYSDVFNTSVSIKSIQQDLLIYNEIYDLVTNLPDFKNCTEAWVDLIAAKPPRIDGKGESISNLSNILINSNFAEQFKSIVRGALIMYGNKVHRVDKLANGQSKIIDMRLSNWIPFMNKYEPSIIEVNVFFNIIDNICEFIEYHENGNIVKTTFEYSNNTLGNIINKEYDEAFNGAGVSPIIVYSGNKVDDDIFGKSLYPSWDSSIASCMRAYENMMTMLEKSKEALLVVPDYASETIGESDMHIINRRGAIEYKNGQDHDVNYVTANLNIENAINVYKETLVRLSRDTDLSLAFFDSRELGSQVSAKALKASMYKTELKANSRITEIELKVKELIVKIALANDIEISLNDFSLITNVGFIQDAEEQMKIIQARNGGAVTMTIEDSIMAYDNISLSDASTKADEIKGIVHNNKTDDISVSTYNDDYIDDDIKFTSSENLDNKDTTNKRNKIRELIGSLIG